MTNEEKIEREHMMERPETESALSHLAEDHQDRCSRDGDYPGWNASMGCCKAPEGRVQRSGWRTRSELVLAAMWALMAVLNTVAGVDAVAEDDVLWSVVSFGLAALGAFMTVHMVRRVLRG